jgi:hypothetical protein
MKNVHDASSNPSGKWVKFGSPNWETIEGLEIYTINLGNGNVYDVDGLCFSQGRWRKSPLSDAASVASYGEFDQIVVDDNLRADSQCENRGNAMLWQNSDTGQRLDLTCVGSNNILLGDRLTVTLPREGVTATNFYVLAVDQNYDVKEWQTKVTCIGSSDSKYIPARTVNGILSRSIKNLQKLNISMKKIP